MTPIVKTRKQAIQYAKEELRRETNLNRLPNIVIRDTEAICGCGFTQAVRVNGCDNSLNNMYSKTIGYCANCGQDTTKGRVRA